MVADGLKGTVNDGSFTVSSDPTQEGLIKATSGALKGEARARVIHPLPWTETFDEIPDGGVPAGMGERDGGKVQSGDAGWAEGAGKGARTTRYSTGCACSSDRRTGRTIRCEADVRVNMKRRQMGDIGITAQRYTLVFTATSRS